MGTDELVEWIKSAPIRRLPTEELLLEIDYAKRERDLADDPDFRDYQAKRVKALIAETKRRERLKEVPKDTGLTEGFIRDIKSRVDIRDILNHLGILVIPSGTGRERYECPAHPDKHPSGVVYVQEQQAHCFQCGFHGDVFDCVMAFRGLTLVQAVDFVCGYLGVELPKPKRRAGGKGCVAL